MPYDPAGLLPAQSNPFATATTPADLAAIMQASQSQGAKFGGLADQGRNLPDVGPPLVDLSSEHFAASHPALNRAADVAMRYPAHVLQGAADMIAAPGQMMQQNPHQTGTEEHEQFERDREQGIAQWAPGMAISMIAPGMAGAEEGALGAAGGRPYANVSDAPLAIKDAVGAEDPAQGMVRLWRGGGNNPGGQKWVTTSRKQAERYTTPGMAYGPKAGSYLQYVDVHGSDPRVQIPPGHSELPLFADPDIADKLQPFYRPKPSD
jgi:hypothetical protein